MSKIKFSCPTCQAKLKVPAQLAGVAGPCPKCGGTIVAPLQSEEGPAPEPAAAAAPTPAMAGSGYQAPAPAPAPAPTPQPAPAPAPAIAPAPAAVAAPAAVNPPPITAPPTYPTASAPAPAPAPVAAPMAPPVAPEPVAAFPRPMEQVSHTAAVALAAPPSTPVTGLATQPPQSVPSAFPAHAPIAPEPTPAPVQAAPVAEAPVLAPAPELVVPQQQPQTILGVSAQQPPEQPLVEEVASHQPVAERAPVETGYDQAYVPKTQPIVVKKKPVEQLPTEPEPHGYDATAFDVPMAEQQPAATGYPEHDAAAAVAPEAYDHQVSYDAADDQPYYADPVEPEIPPAAEPHQVEMGYEQPETVHHYEEQPQEGLVGVDPEFDEDHLPDTGDGSMAAFFAEGAQDPAPIPPETGVEPQPDRPKSEILDELLASTPATEQKRKEKKKGLSLTSVLMLITLGLVVVISVLGVGFAVQKAGGLSTSQQKEQGEQGGKNLEQKRQNFGEETAAAAGSTDEIPVNLNDGIAPDSMSFDDAVKKAITESGASDAIEIARAGVDSGEQPIAIPPIQPAPEITPPPPAIPDIEPPAPDASTPVIKAPAPTPIAGGIPEVNTEYKPEPFYPAPGPDDLPLKNTHALVEAFLKAPDYRGRVAYSYQGHSKEPTMRAYYNTWPDFSMERYKIKLFQMELDPEFGGPFWVYQILMNDADDTGGVPMIIREEAGNLKVDWEVYSEFRDQHFVKFLEGRIAGPASFRVVAERVSEYPGPDKGAFTNSGDYLCYELNPPYGGYRAHSEYAFIKKGTVLGDKMDQLIALGDDPLAVIVTLDFQEFHHGIRHLVIKEFINEGWLR